MIGMPKRRILIVDDDLIARLLLSENLSKYGTCDAVVDGKEAVRAFRLALQRNKPYDLTCVDIMMPNMDGIETIRKIRQIEEEHNLAKEKRVPVIMITALLNEFTQKTSYDGRCEGYLTKPINNEELVEKLEEFNLI